MRATVNFYLTWKCNFLCDHCVHECGPQGYPMTQEQLEYGYKFCNWLLSQNVPLAIIGLTGGEPILHPNFWDGVMPNVVSIRQAHKLHHVELHTNASVAIPEEYRKGYYKFFSQVIVGHDICHHKFRTLAELYLQDYTDISLCLTLRQNKYIIPSTGQEAIFVRNKGRAAESIKNGKLIPIFWPETPKQECSWFGDLRGMDCLHFAFTPDHINHCGEKSHVTPSAVPHGQFHPYGTDYETLLHAGLSYQTKYCANNCSQPCVSIMTVFPSKQ